MNFNSTLKSLQLDKPIVLSSGHFGFAEELNTIKGFPWQSIGAIVLKATTLLAKEGHQGERIIETPYALLNSVGLENPGVETVVKNKLTKLRPLNQKYNQNIRWIANVAGQTIEEYQQVCQQLQNTTIDALEINISCPNVKKGGAEFGNDPQLASEVVAACREATQKPLIIKLSPNQTDIAKTAEKCIEKGADILSAINTVSAMMIDIYQQKPSLAGIKGGLSGSAIFPIALLNVHKIYQISKEKNIPIIAQGGISDGSQAIAMLLAGASAIALGTALSKDLNAPKKILQAIEKYCQKFGYSHFSEITGALKL